MGAPAAGTPHRWIVREAGREDFPALRACMEQILVETAGQKAPGFGQPFWEWQYLEEGHGSIVVVADDGGSIAGYYHVLLLGMRYGGRAATAAMVQDVATLAAYRGQGVFRAMGGLALQCMRERGVDFIYTFPNAKSLPSFLRNHAYTVAGRVPVRVASLDPGRLLAERFRLGAAGRLIGALAAPFHAALRAGFSRLGSTERVVAIAGGDDRIGDVAREFAAPVSLALDRTPAYLAWRFLAKPTHEYTIWGLERADRLLAYLVTRVDPVFGVPCLVLMDLGSAAGEEPALLRLIAARMAAEGRAGAALAFTVGLHPFFRRLTRLGFVRVPERLAPRPLDLVCKPLAPAVGRDLLDPARWLITLADWDVF